MKGILHGTRTFNLTETYYEKESYIDNVPLKINTTLDWHITTYRYKDEFDLIAALKILIIPVGILGNFSCGKHEWFFDFTTEKIFLKPAESFKSNMDSLVFFICYL